MCIRDRYQRRVHGAKSLYNLAVTMLILGTKLLESSDYREQHAGIQKFKTGIWAINEVRQLYPIYIQFGQQIDLSLQNLNIIENIFRGWTFYAVYIMLEPNEKQMGCENLAALINQTAKHFFLAGNDLANSKYPAEFTKILKRNFFYYSYYPQLLSFQKMIKYHLSKQEDEPLKGHIGIAVSYMKYCLNIINSVVGNSMFQELEQPSSSKILGMKNNLAELCQIYVNKNNQIYKQKEFEAFALAGAPEIPNNFRIISKPPPSMQVPLENIDALDNILNQQFNQEIDKVLEQLQERIKQFSDNLQKFENAKIMIFQKNLINFFLQCNENAGALAQNSPSRFQEKINEFKQVGGYKYYSRTSEEILNIKLNCEKTLTQITQSLEEEKQVDDNLRLQYKYNWNRTPSAAIQLEYIQQINIFKQVMGYKTTQLEQLTNQKNAYQQQILKFQDEQNPQFKELLNQNIDSKFFSQNKQQIEQLKGIINMFENLLKQCNQLLVELDQLKTEKHIQDQIRNALIAKQPIEQIVSQVTSESSQFKQYQQNFMQLTKFLEEIQKQAQPLVQEITNHQNVNATQIEQLTKELEEILQLHQQFEIAKKDWIETQNSIQKLEISANDTIMARKIDLKERIQIVENQLSQEKVPLSSNLKNKSNIPQQLLGQSQQPEQQFINLSSMHKSVFFQEETKPEEKINEDIELNFWESQEIDNPEEFKQAFENFKKFI
eukprot:TRINITY_DN14428_c0_g1_i3.p1 TRINITY_DN14428_c0_g1~~TRINITY_DN14428_c0_g1_i3.p1  ORF type:complete len:719 (+),score=140.93 TRINITY_DN14428_c0_g1_i3:188-2344(+)